MPRPPNLGIGTLCTFLSLGISSAPIKLAIFFTTGTNKAVKKKDDKKPVDNLEQLYDNARLKLSSMSKLLLTNAAFMMYLSTNPIMQNMLYTITNFNYDLDMASKMLGMTKEGVVSSLNTLSTVCYGYMADMKQYKSSGFTDDSEKEREIGRRY